MRRITLAAVVLVFASAPLAVASQPKSFELGIILGQPTGLSAKLWLDHTSAVDLAAAWQFIPVGSFYIHADYLYHIYHLFPVTKGQLPLYVGVGGSVTLQSTPTVGLRFPVGVEYIFPKAPLDLFVEVGLGLSLFPATQMQAGGGIGVRYTF